MHPFFSGISHPMRVRSAGAMRQLMLAGVLLGTLGNVQAQSTAPQYGGTLSIANMFRTVNPMTFDPADWSWKISLDLGAVNEMLFVADLDKSKGRGGKHAFTVDSYLPTDAMRGELAESWQLLDNPRRVEIKLRKGVMFPEKKGVMAKRELVADDVVHTFNVLSTSPKRPPSYYDYIEKVEAKDSHTVVFTFKRYMADWDYRFGWNNNSGIVPKEVTTAGAANWRNANGTGPFMLSNYVQGNTLTYTKNKDYWDSTTIGGKPYKLPFVDTMHYRLIKDDATALTALRTGKLDLMESIPWSAVEELKKSAPQLKWNRWLSPQGATMPLRTDTKPFDDVRVRRALNMAIDRQQLIKSFYGGNAEMLTFPMHPDYAPYYEGLDTMPQSIKDLFSYKPEEAKKLLAEAGYPNGLKFTVQSSAAATNNEMLSLIAAQLAKVGVTMEIQVIENTAFTSQLLTHKLGPVMFINLGAANPTSSLRKGFSTGQLWNPSMYSDKAFDEKVAAMLAEPDEAKRVQMLKAMTREILDKAPHIWLPTAYNYTAWWPWVQNYHGELSAGAYRPGPIHARIWIDQEMKKKMGYR